MTHTKLLVVSTDSHMSKSQRTTFTASVQAIADKVGAELLVLNPGQHAELLGVCDEPANAGAGEIKAGIFSGRFIPTRTQSDAMRLVAGLINSGAVDLREDVYSPGQRVFRCLKISDATASLPDAHDEPLPIIEPLNAAEGVALSFQLDPLESAISQVVQMLGDEMVRMAEASVAPTTVHQRLEEHLNALLSEQLKRVTSAELSIAAG